jgi:RND family efflux transporter MFP subunit
MKKSTKRILSILAVLAIIGVVIMKLVSNRHKVTDRAENAIQQQVFDVIPVKTVIVKTSSFNDHRNQEGVFAAQQELKLNAQTQGQIKTLLVKKTQMVAKGTLLATIDNSGQSSQLETAKAALVKAQQDADRMRNSLKSGGVTQQQVEAAEFQVQNAQTSLSQLQQQTGNFKIIAPISGVINEIYAEEGSYVSMGTPVIQLVDITKVILTVGVNQEMIPEIKLGQDVKVTTDVYPDLIMNGKIETANVKADASQKIQIGISVQNTREHPILAGMFGRAEFLSDKKAAPVSFLSIPREAIIGSIQNAKVYIVDADNTVKLRSISTGKNWGNQIEVTGGLKIGEQVVTAGQINLQEGTKIIVKN